MKTTEFHIQVKDRAGKWKGRQEFPVQTVEEARAQIRAIGDRYVGTGLRIVRRTVTETVVK